MLPAYGSHFPVLAAMVAQSSGPVLELGAGDFSTPLLHLMCEPGRRSLDTVETDPAWLESFTDLRTDWHRLHSVELDGWDRLTWIDERRWGLVFVDHRPGERRIVDIARLRGRADFLVVHDTEERGYGYEPVLATFPHRWDWKRCSAWTTVVSLEHPIPLGLA